MPVSDLPTPEEIAAGPFAQWLADFRASLRGTQGMEVPCGDCVGCCISGYPVWLRPSDTRALARIPVTVLFSSSGIPADHRLMLAREDGSCPMLSDRKCTIYADRPQTCLDYDCRVFAAAAIAAGGDDRSVINHRVRAWRFSYPTPEDERVHEAVRAAAAFIRDHGTSFPGRAPSAPSGVAVLAVKSYGVFLDPSLAS
ncbi:MAG TPA: YkgJ family cysteine cluster protein, partial [Povalibacter sp.]